MARRGLWVRVAVGLIKPTMTVFSRYTWRGAEHIPDTGGAIVAANHLSHVDTLALAHFVYNAGRVPHFLAKDTLLNAPFIGRPLRSTGQIPVRRGTIDAARSLDEAVASIDAGHLVVVYPEGTTTRHPDFWPMHARTGVARLALATRAPVIPVALWGPQRLYDPIARRLRPRPRTPVTTVAGPAMDLTRWYEVDRPGHAELTALSDEIMVRVRDLLADIRGEPAPDLYEWPPRRRR